MKRIMLYVVMVVALACKTEVSKKTFEVNAKLNGFPENTLVMLRVDDKIDSTYIKNGTVNFKGNVKEPRRAALYVEYSNDWLYFWLENEEIDIVAEKWKFREGGIVTGSENQKLEEVLLSRLVLKMREADSIRQIAYDNTLSSEKIVSAEVYLKDVIGQMTEIQKEFIEDYPNSLVGLSVFERYTVFYGKSECARLYDLLNEESRNSEYGKSIKKYIGQEHVLKIGDPFVDFEQQDSTGKLVKLSEKLGKYTLVEVWASWCGPCRRMTPELQVEYRKYKDKGFNIVGVSLDSKKENWLEAIEKDKLEWDNISSLNGRKNFVTKAYHISSIPDNILIDENGIIIGRKLNGSKLRTTLKVLFE